MIKQDELRKWYDREYSVNPRRFTRDDKGYKPFVRHLSPRSGRKLLDVACGTGGFLKLTQARGLKVYGLDLSAKAVALARRRVPRAKIKVGNGEALPFGDDYFDYVTNIGSLEHYLDQAQGIREMIRVLKNNGRMLIVLPNSFWEMHKGTGQKHEVLNTLKSWSCLLSENGLDIVSVHKDFGPAVFHDLKPHKVVLRAFGKLLAFIMPVSFAYQFVFICEPQRSKIK